MNFPIATTTPTDEQLASAADQLGLKPKIIKAVIAEGHTLLYHPGRFGWTWELVKNN